MTFENQRSKQPAGIPAPETLVAWSNGVSVDPGPVSGKPPQTGRAARALFNRIIRATIDNNPAVGDRLLDKLRELQRDCPADAAAREALAAALLHTFTLATEQTRRAAAALCLDEMRGLYRDWPEDALVREALALGLMNASLDAMSAADETDALRFLEELDQMRRRGPEDSRNCEGFSPLMDGDAWLSRAELP